MKKPKLIAKKRQKRKPIAAKHLVVERDRAYLLTLSDNARARVLRERIRKARLVKQEQRRVKASKKKRVPVLNLTPSNKPINV